MSVARLKSEVSFREIVEWSAFLEWSADEQDRAAGVKKATARTPEQMRQMIDCVARDG